MVLAVVLASVTFGSPTPAIAAPVRPDAPSAACSGTSGVTVVVDASVLGGGVRIGCASGDPASGAAALSSAGNSYSFVPGKGPFICQINSQPNPCNGAPETAYWSYWYAVPGGSWQYSNVGAGSRDPDPGEVEGWAFGAGQQPSVVPPRASAPTTTPPTTARPQPAPTTPGSPTTTPGSPTTVPGSPATTAPTGAPTTTAAGTSAPVTGPDGSTSSTTGSSPPADGEGDDDSSTATRVDEELANAPVSSTSDGGGAGTIIALVVVLALAGGAAFEVWRRRGSTP